MIWCLVFIIGASVAYHALQKDKRIVPPPIARVPALQLPILSPLEADEETTTSDPLLAIDRIDGPFLLNIFASWCVPCIYEHPQITALAQSGYSVYAILYKDTIVNAQKWLKRHGNPYRIIAIDNDGSAAIELGISGIPETFIVDSSGQIRYRHPGPITMQDMQSVILPLLQSLDEKES